MIKEFLKKYGIHILVEVFIIVVGVLIALQVNNWNENRRQNKQLKGILQKVMKEWEQDTLSINSYIQHYEPYIEEYDKVIERKMTDAGLDSCKVCRGLILNYYPYKSESIGIDLLQKHITSSNVIKNDTVIYNIIQGQKTLDETLNQMAQRITDDVDHNLLHISNKEWFGDMYTSPKITNDYRQYYKSNDFRNRTIRHKIFIYNNMIFTLKRYKEYIISSQEELENKLKEL